MITRASARKGFSLLELIVVLVVLGLLAAIAIPTYQALIKRTQDKTAIATAESVARNAIGLAAFDRASVVTDGSPDGLTAYGSTTYLDAASTAAEVEGVTVGVVDPGTDADGEVCVNLTVARGTESVPVHIIFQEGLNASFEAEVGTCS